MREKVLLVGEPNVSKTFSLVSLAILYPESRVVLFDPDDGVSKLLRELGLEEMDNLSVLPVGPDWLALMDQYRAAKSTLKEGDWLCLDMLGRFWDLAQQYYSTYVFGENPVEHLMTLKKQAKSVSFGGFDGMTDWPLIKRLHNELLLDDAVLRSKFNVMATTAAGQILKIGNQKATGELEGIYQKEFGIKPEGEKHNPYRFDTQAVLYRRDGRYWFRMVRDRGRGVDLKQEFEITGRSFWEVYRERL